MYREPAQRERAERLETILLAADLDNLEGAAERVSAKQDRFVSQIFICIKKVVELFCHRIHLTQDPHLI